MKIKCKGCDKRTLHTPREKILSRPRVTFHLGKSLSTRSVIEYRCNFCGTIYGKKPKEDFSGLTPA